MVVIETASLNPKATATRAPTRPSAGAAPAPAGDAAGNADSAAGNDDGASTSPEWLRKLVCAAYAAPQYHGETALHFAVVHRDLELVRKLVDAGADIDAHADGLFFYERVNTYFGGRPVGLAAHLGELEILEYLCALRIICV